MSATSATVTVEKIVEKPAFNEKETKLLTVAMLSLKSGPPEIDIQKFMTGGGFNTIKTAQNTWGVLKKKLASMSPATENGDTGSGSTAVSSKSHACEPPNFDPADNFTAATAEKKTPKKRTKKESSGDDDAEVGGSPTKKAKKTPTPRKTAAQKKAEAAAEAGEEGAEEGAGDSPVKKTRAPRKSPAKKITAAKQAEADAEAIKQEEKNDAENENENETETEVAAEKETTVAEDEVAGEDVKME